MTIIAVDSDVPVKQQKRSNKMTIRPKSGKLQMFSMQIFRVNMKNRETSYALKYTDLLWFKMDLMWKSCSYLERINFSQF